jgi:rhodanese-related sulfurtransferase
MRTFVRELLGGAVLLLVAAILGLAVNAVRPGGVPLILAGAPVSTVSHARNSAADSAAAPGAPLAEGAVTVEQVKEALDAGSAVVIDARSTTEYEEGHLPGAINIPHDRLPEFMETLTAEVPTDGQVIVYCRGPECDFSDLLATELKVMGYQSVSVFPGGWEHWTAAGHPTEAGPR